MGKMLCVMEFQNSEELNSQINIPELGNETANPIEVQNFISDSRTAQGIHTIQFIGDLVVVHSRINSKSTLPVSFIYNNPAVVLEFILSGRDVQYKESGQNHLAYKPGQHFIAFIPPSKMEQEYQASEKNEVLRIYIAPDYFKRLVPQNHLFEIFLKHIDSATFSVLNPVPMPITPAMYILIKELHVEQQSTYRYLWLRAKVLELLKLQLEVYEELKKDDHSSVLSASSLSPFEVNKMCEVKEILHKNMHANFTLIDLAHMVGTNMYTLKKNFKECFGDTVFGYLNQIRMEEAQRLLLGNSHSINQIADLVGYKNANHFSTAFKRYFGYKPSEVKKKLTGDAL